jgi:hypothetical protein
VAWPEELLLDAQLSFGSHSLRSLAVSQPTSLALIGDRQFRHIDKKC